MEALLRGSIFQLNFLDVLLENFLTRLQVFITLQIGI